MEQILNKIFSVAGEYELDLTDLLAQSLISFAQPYEKYRLSEDGHSFALIEVTAPHGEKPTIDISYYDDEDKDFLDELSEKIRSGFQININFKKVSSVDIFYA